MNHKKIVFVLPRERKSKLCVTRDGNAIYKIKTQIIIEFNSITMAQSRSAQEIK